MESTPDGHPVRESASFRDAHAALGHPDRIDEALSAVLWGCHCAPEEFPVIEGLKTLRLAKTSAVLMDDGSVVAALRVVLHIISDHHQTVELLYIEAIEQEA